MNSALDDHTLRRIVSRGGSRVRRLGIELCEMGVAYVLTRRLGARGKEVQIAKVIDRWWSTRCRR